MQRGLRIPSERFGAANTPESVAAMKAVWDLGNHLVENSPGIASLYRQRDPLLTYAEIALRVIPDLAQTNIYLASKAVGYACRRLISIEEQEEFCSLRRRQTLERIAGGLRSEENLDRLSQARAVLAAQGARNVDAMAMILSMGRTPWTDEEKFFAREAVLDPGYVRSYALLKDRYVAIASDLNDLFHDGKTVRTGAAIYGFVRIEQKKLNQAF